MFNALLSLAQSLLVNALLRNWFSGRYSEVFEARRTKEESQPPVRAKVGATWVPFRSENQL